MSLTKEDGSFRCLCREGTSGRNCEFSEIHTVKPFTTKAPVVIPISNVTDVTSTTVSTTEEFVLNRTTTEPVKEDTTKKSEPVISENET